MIAPPTPGLRRSAAMAVVIGLAEVACQPSLVEKDRCRGDGDCAGKRVCIAQRCTGRDVPDSAVGDGSPLPELFITAHTDDLLFFMNPDVQVSIRSGRPSQTVVVASGHADGQPMITQSIERRTLAVFSAMTVMGEREWNCAQRLYAGKQTLTCTHSAQPSVAVTFLRLRASIPPSSIFLPNLWARNVGTAYPVVPVSEVQQVIEGGDAYSRADLIDVLAAIMAASGANVVGVSEATTTYGDDNVDSTAVGNFAIEASHRYGAVHSLRVYRGYNVFIDWDSDAPLPDERNLTSAEHDDKARLLQLYDGITASENRAWDEWCWRRYAYRQIGADVGTLRVRDRCLAPPASLGLPPFMRSCDGSPVWTLQADHRIEAPGGGCLGLAADVASAEVVSCAWTADQQWTLMENGQLLGMNAACLTFAGDEGTPSADLCGSDRAAARFGVPLSQRWTLGQRTLSSGR